MSRELDVLVKLRNQLLELESKYRDLAKDAEAAEDWMTKYERLASFRAYEISGKMVSSAILSIEHVGAEVKTEETFKWECPQCGAVAGKHGNGGKSKCISTTAGCDGLICECDPRDLGNDYSAKDHGVSHSNPCQNASCYHCGWGGRLPPVPKKMQPWEKKAMDAGWTPPAGWGH